MMTLINKAVLRLLADAVIDNSLTIEQATYGLYVPDKKYVLDRYLNSVMPLRPHEECPECCGSGVV